MKGGAPVEKKREPTADVAGNCLENLFNLSWAYLIAVPRFPYAIPHICGVDLRIEKSM